MRLEVKLQGDRVRLVPYSAWHVAKYHEWMKDPWLLEMTASEPLSLPEEQEMQVTWREDPTKATFIVHAHGHDDARDEDEASMAGDVNLFFNDDEDPANCEIDIMIAEASKRGLGLGKEAVLLMMAYAVDKMGVHRFYSKINETNEASLGLFRKLGYKECNYVKAFQEFEFEFHVQEEQRAMLAEILRRTSLLPMAQKDY
ncbi:hypothetical protein SPRG_10361 [Saprolegnia parasitica CBS 223.65]|uniref:N-acetyltransferase domain-containing protein n=1 Tax=Saprolegnia parasitica (strain CBS 223.65) TaxID=695850 RepID=A0A067CDB6_SAPPC|nr:hypothetical protein SPRG_10361 [Saprolegnia parasitica CBS 223.65]KDO24546.1 hypothetical protein SPRG_10361 [Saprolegnia parasitica CBS 223.65]|eukprot:XP_012204807.1 hypothetical protein SPRG_10361 [Saprolegnia parasitica CBS 223.65]